MFCYLTQSLLLIFFLVEPGEVVIWNLLSRGSFLSSVNLLYFVTHAIHKWITSYEGVLTSANNSPV